MSEIAPICILYAGGPDPWAPYSHMKQLMLFKQKGLVPNNIQMIYKDSLRHGFVAYYDMVPIVVDYVCNCIVQHTVAVRSKL